MANYEERRAEMQAIYDSKIDAFKGALKARCERDGVSYQCINQGIREFFVVGEAVFQIQVTDISIHWDIVGRTHASNF